MHYAWKNIPFAAVLIFVSGALDALAPFRIPIYCFIAATIYFILLWLRLAFQFPRKLLYEPVIVIGKKQSISYFLNGIRNIIYIGIASMATLYIVIYFAFTSSFEYKMAWQYVESSDELRVAIGKPYGHSFLIGIDEGSDTVRYARLQWRVFGDNGFRKVDMSVSASNTRPWGLDYMIIKQ